VTAAAPRIGIVGAGSIGVAWALVFARSGSAVVLQDPDPARREQAPLELRARLLELARFELIDEPAAAIAARVEVAAEVEAAVAAAAYVQECAPESLELKWEAVLASSSSALPASAFASGLAGRGRCLVAHPGNPPYLLPVVELVPAEFTRPDVVDRAAAVLEGARMTVVRLAREVEGFVFNRLQGALLREAYCLVRDGVVGVEDVDRIVREGLGRRWAVIGPFETSDLNTRGGVEVHAARMGSAYERMGAERGQHDPWTPDLVARVTAERRALLPLDRWEERVAWRDRSLMTHLAGSGRMQADRSAITRLLHRYCAMLDSMELELVPELFTADCSVIYGPDERMQSRGAANLQSSLRRLHRFARTSHHLSNIDIDIDGPDAAHGRSYVLAWHQHPDGRTQTLYAEYHDRFVRTGGSWRIAERRQLTHGSDVEWDLPLALSDERRPPPEV
jgi:3-hydroxyacyl-CoA dehydrogenase/3-phenylpropionate/cinnamic acid dioxygenase small subunit